MKFEKNEKLDEFAIELLRADVLPAARADEIAGAPHLLNSIHARIAAEKSALKTAENRIAAPKTAVSFWQSFFAFKKQIAIGFAAVSAVVVIWQLTVLTAPDRAPVNTIAERPPQKITTSDDFEMPAVKAKDFALREQTSQPTIERVVSTKPAKSSEHSRAAVKTNFARASRTEQKSVAPRRANAAFKRNKTPEFYSLAFAGELDANETKQIVRVKLSPDALDALGVAVPTSAPLAKSVTADLLLGEDGVPRAIRFVE